MATNKPFKVLVTHPEYQKSGIDILKHECEIIVCEKLPPNREEILEKCKGVDGILWGSHLVRLDGEILEAAGKNLKAISTRTGGLDYVDLKTLKECRMPLGHVPKAHTDGVADIAIGLMIAAARRFHEAREKILASQWEVDNLQWMLGKDIRGSTVGFFGFGGVGEAIASRLEGFSVGEFLYCSRTEKTEATAKYGAKRVVLDELCRKSDFLIIACPLTNDTKHIFNKKTFDKMKSSACLINIGRGAVVDQDALYDALKSNKMFSAGIDVMDPEPLPKDHKLLKLSNLVITPHIGTATLQTRAIMAEVAAQNVLNGMKGKPMISPAYNL